jgi:hypothetical protein
LVLGPFFVVKQVTLHELVHFLLFHVGFAGRLGCGGHTGNIAGSIRGFAEIHGFGIQFAEDSNELVALVFEFLGSIGGFLDIHVLQFGLFEIVGFDQFDIGFVGFGNTIITVFCNGFGIVDMDEFDALGHEFGIISGNVPDGICAFCGGIGVGGGGFSEEKEHLGWMENMGVRLDDVDVGGMGCGHIYLSIDINI